jgi:hypothetical protein
MYQGRFKSFPIQEDEHFELVAPSQSERPGWHSLRRNGLAAGHGEASGIGIHVTSPWPPKTRPSRPVNGRTTRQIDTNETRPRFRPDPRFRPATPFPTPQMRPAPVSDPRPVSPATPFLPPPATPFLRPRFFVSSFLVRATGSGRPRRLSTVWGRFAPLRSLRSLRCANRPQTGCGRGHFYSWERGDISIRARHWRCRCRCSLRTSSVRMKQA